MTAKIKITYPANPIVTLASLALGDFFSFPTTPDRAYIVIGWDEDMQEMSYQALADGMTFCAVDDLRRVINPLRLKSAELEVSP